MRIRGRAASERDFRREARPVGGRRDEGRLNREGPPAPIGYGEARANGAKGSEGRSTSRSMRKSERRRARCWTKRNCGFRSLGTGS